jgi:hypothetical protein
MLLFVIEVRDQDAYANNKENWDAEGGKEEPGERRIDV